MNVIVSASHFDKLDAGGQAVRTTAFLQDKVFWSDAQKRRAVRKSAVRRQGGAQAVKAGKDL